MIQLGNRYPFFLQFQCHFQLLALNSLPQRFKSSCRASIKANSVRLDRSCQEHVHFRPSTALTITGFSSGVLISIKCQATCRINGRKCRRCFKTTVEERFLRKSKKLGGSQPFKRSLPSGSKLNLRSKRES